MRGDRGNLANPAVALRDIIRGEARKISKMQDQISMGVVTDRVDGIDVEVLIDGFGAGPLTALWCASGRPEVDQRVVLAALTGGQKWFVIAIAAQSGEFFAGSSFGRVTFNGNGSFIKAGLPGLRAVTVKCQGGGGGGGGAGATAGAQVSGGGGGGGGGYAESVILASDLSAVETVTRGGAGAGGVGAGNGGAGQASSFGSLVVAGGGSGAGFAAAATPARITLAGAGGSGTTGDFRVKGDGGTGAVLLRASVSNGVMGGSGGASHLGGGAKTARGPAAGNAGGVFGGGGGGAANQESESARNGGAGALGIVVVELHF